MMHKRVNTPSWLAHTELANTLEAGCRRSRLASHPKHRFLP